MPGQITVACKIPNGLILRLFDMIDVDEPVMGGGTKTVKHAQLKTDIAPIKIEGPAIPFGTQPDYRIAGGYALTQNVDADVFNEWMKQNADHDAVRNKLIFAHEKAEFVEKRAKDNKAVLSGLQPLVPPVQGADGKVTSIDARIPRSNRNITVATDDKAA